MKLDVSEADAQILINALLREGGRLSRCMTAQGRVYEGRIQDCEEQIDALEEAHEDYCKRVQQKFEELLDPEHLRATGQVPPVAPATNGNCCRKSSGIPADETVVEPIRWKSATAASR